MQSGNHSLLLTGPTHVQLKDVGPAVTVKVLIRVLSEAKKTAAACGMKTHDLIRPMLASGSTDRYFYVLSLEATTRVESGVLQLLGCVAEAVPETCLQQVQLPLRHGGLGLSAPTTSEGSQPSCRRSRWRRWQSGARQRACTRLQGRGQHVVNLFAHLHQAGGDLFPASMLELDEGVNRHQLVQRQYMRHDAQ